MKEFSLKKSSKSLTATAEEPDAVSLLPCKVKGFLVVTQNVQCPYHRERPCDCDRYFARHGTAEWGC
jgi:hypothetical protein